MNVLSRIHIVYGVSSKHGNSFASQGGDSLDDSLGI
jgi:hypothetical protein